MHIREKERHLNRLLEKCDRAAVAFSGGADSSLLLSCAIKVLGPDKVIAFTFRSCLQKRHELDRVGDWLADHDLSGLVTHLFVDIDPLSWEEFTVNPVDRCYICKSRVYHLFLDRAAEFGMTCLIDGTNADDMLSDRPGLRALRELGIGTPLADAGLSKEDVRMLSRETGLNTWNRPSSSCLATRIPAGMEITGQRIDLVARAEMILEEMGFIGCRVRLDLNDKERVYIEVLEKDVHRLVSDINRRSILEKMKKIGFFRVLLDMYGR
ncbi:MAG: ATP-dependent sacrificial sulfur transferase LarE [Desulfobulbaceae bacterium]|nr:ATP-dependent sacrificial sulfur transferase LarE [Desulfobulbaceae bacterium]